MSWEDSKSLEYVSRKSRKKGNIEEFVEIRRIVENNEIKEVKLIIGSEKGQIGLNLTISDWKSLLIFLNNVKTKNLPLAKAVPQISEEKQSLKGPVEFAKTPIELPKEEKIAEIPGFTVHRKAPVEKVEKLPPSPPVKARQKEIPEIKVIQDQLNSQLKTAEKEASNIINVLESSIEPALQKSVDSEGKATSKEVDLSKSMEILGFHEKEEQVKPKQKDLKIDLPTLKPMPKHPTKPSIQVKKTQAVPDEINLDEVQDLQKLFPELKEDKSGTEKGIQKISQKEILLDDKVADMVLKDQDLKEFSDEIIKKALALQEELGVDKEEKEKKIRVAVEDVASFMPSGPAKEFVSSMLDKKPTSLEDSVIVKLKTKKEEPKPEINMEVEPIDSIRDKIDEIDKKYNKNKELLTEKKEKTEDIIDLEKIRKDEPIRTIEQGPADDVPTIWELMEEKEKLDEDNRLELSQNTSPVNVKRKKLRFW